MRVLPRNIYLLAVAASPLQALYFTLGAGKITQRLLFNGRSLSASEIDNEGTAADVTIATPYRRRARYSGKYPKNFTDKYKEQSGDEETINKVLSKGMTPAGTHVPIMVKECLHYMGLEDSGADKKNRWTPIGG